MADDLSDAFDAVAAALLERRDEEAAEPMAAYMKDQFDFLGIRSADRRRIQKPLIAAARTATPDELLDVAERCWERDERELQYVGCDLLRAGAKHLRAEDLDRVRGLIARKSWWDTVDSLAAHTVGPIVRANPQLGKTMDRWIDDPDMWIARTAILHQLMYKEDVDEDRLFEYAIRRAADTEFFIRKALGWALRNYARVAPHAVGLFVAEHADELSGLTKREATKHL